MDAFLFLLDLVVMTYLCWRVFRADKAGARANDELGWMAHKADDAS